MTPVHGSPFIVRVADSNCSSWLGYNPISSWAIDSTCSEGQVVGRRAKGAGWSHSMGLMVPLIVFEEGQVYVQYMQFMASPEIWGLFT